MTEDSTREEFLVVGEIKKPHGIKGECSVMPATDDVAGVYVKGRQLLLGDPHGHVYEPATALRVASARSFKDRVLVAFEGVHDRNAVEPLRGRTLLIRRADARPLEPGEYFLHDLDGLEVRTANGERVGRVTTVYEGGAVPYLGVDDGEREHLVPLSPQVVEKVDLEGGVITIDPPPGLLAL